MYHSSSFSVRLCLRTFKKVFKESISVFFDYERPTLLISLVFLVTKYYWSTTYVAYSEQPKLVDVFKK